MLWLSMIVNVGVLVPLVGALLRNGPGIADSFGGDTPARRILICLYATIAAASLAALAQPHKAAEIAHTLLPLQVLYKLLTWPALGIRHRVVQVNLAIAVLHTATTVTLYAG